MKENFDESKNSVRCNVCSFFLADEKKCSVKDMKVHPKKNRYCTNYMHDDNKVVRRKVLPSIRGIIDKELRKKHKQELRKLKNNNVVEAIHQLDDPFPVTGDLSRFKTTATNEG